MVWMPHEMDERPEDFSSGSIDWQALFDKNDPPLALYDIKPSRDGTLSGNSAAQVRARQPEFQADPSSFDACRVGVASAQAKLYSTGRMSRG